ncbi:MAG: TolC family protein [Bacteroidales bacterium]|nr:TolC family protein [Bacteroidales bacterium]
MNKLNVFVFIVLFSISSGIYAQQERAWTLEACINHALEQNIQVRKSNLNNQSLDLYYDQAKASRLPNLSASASQNFSWTRPTSILDPQAINPLEGSTGSSYSLNSGVTVFNGGRLKTQVKQAELDMQNGQLSLEATRESISLNILNAFLQVLYAEEQVKNAEKQIESTTGQLTLAKERLDLGAISQADYTQVKSQLASEKLTLANATSQLAISKVNLMQLMELPVTGNFEIERPNLEATINQNRVPDVQSVYDTALAIKPQIKSAAINKESALLDEKAAKAGLLPSLSASAGVSTRANYSYSQWSMADGYFDQLDKSLNPSAGLSLSIPIYQRKQAKTSVEVAKIGYQNAELSELDTKNQLRKNIEQACQDVVSAQIEYAANLENYQATKESSDLSDEKYFQGLISAIDYMVSKTTLITSESRLLQSKFNLIFSYKILDFYSGIPLTL